MVSVRIRLGRMTLGLSLLAAAMIAGAAMKPESPGGKAEPGQISMLDARVNLQSSYLSAVQARGGGSSGRAAANQYAIDIGLAIDAWRETLPGLDVARSGLTGAPTSVRNTRGALTAAAPGQGNEAIVRSFLLQRGAIYGLDAADAGDIEVVGDSAGSANGLRMLRTEQVIAGRAVFQSETRFTLDRQGRIVKSVGVMVPHARSIAPSLAGAPLIDAKTALARLMQFENRMIDLSGLQSVAGEQGRARLVGEADYITGEVDVRDVWFPLAPGLLVPAWSLVVFTEGSADWYAVVDAQTGDVLWRKNMRDYASAHDARFRVYVQADGVTPAESPAPLSPTTVTPGSGTQAAAIAPTIVGMHAAMDAIASPNGWIEDCPAGGCTANETQTLGNNVLACLDRIGGANANICDTDLDGNGRPTGNPDANARDRDFLGTTPRDFQTGYLPPPQGGNPEAGQTATGTGAAHDQFRRGAVTQLFYTSNWYHDQLFALGFDEGSGNFQQTNFSGFGLGGDRVLADAQDASGTNNANFSTPPDGTSGRMQMYNFTGPTIDRDGSLDAVIVIHELTHGTSNRLIGNAAGLGWAPGSGMGEGWSDFYALSLLNGTNAHDPDASYAAGAYATYKLGGLLDNYLYAIRRFPYSTDNTVNPLTWADVDDVTFDLSGGIAASPLNFSDSGGMEVHNAGEIWALSLWEVRSRIIADPNGASGDVPTGNHTMLQLVTDAMKMTPISPSFEQARDALFDADCAINGCANEESIWGGFADRGLGFLAATRYRVAFGYTAAHLGVTESFELPRLYVADVAADVAIDDSAANNNGAPDPGEPVLLTVRLTNPWRAAGKAATGATATLSTATPGVTILDGDSSYGAIAPQASASGDSFAILLDQALPCGSRIDFSLSVTSNLGTTVETFSLRIGAANGTDPVVTYTRDTNPDLAIPDNRPRAVFDTLNIADDFVIADIDLRLDNVTHTWTGDLTAMLRSPGGIGVDQMSLIGGLTDGGPGDNMVNMVMDDDVAQTAANDMVQAVSSAAPYTKSWLPVFNSPWAVLAGFPPADPVGTFSRLDGTSTLGTWSLAMSDQAAGDTGTLRSWSMLVTPVHFDCTVFVGAPAPTATKTVSGTFTVGGTVTYTVTITNSGTGTLADNPGDEFTDVLPAGLTLVSASATSGTAIATFGTNTVTWNGTLAQLGGAVTITIQATVNGGTQGTQISNQGTVSYDSDGNGTNEATMLTDDPAVGGASDPTVFQVGGAQLSATKTVTGTFTAGGSVTYTITIGNAGVSASLDNAGDEFTDTLPAGLSVSSAVATSGTASTAGNTVTWNGSVPAGGSVTLTIQASIAAGTAVGTTFSNQGTLNYDADLNGSNETTILTDDPAVGGAADPTDFVTFGAAISATKTVAGAFVQGSTVVYTIVLSNAGNADTMDNPGDELVDVLPPALALVNATADAGLVFADSGSNTVAWNGSIPAGGSVTITINATILMGGTISNQATFAYDANLDGSNESTGVSDDPAVAGSADPTVFGAQSMGVLVPIASQWALALLALALFGFAAATQRRR